MGIHIIGPAPGLAEFRSVIAEVEGNRRNMKFEANEVVVCPGAKPIMFYAIMASVDPDDEVIYPNPGFPIYESCIELAGGVPIPLVLKEENGFRFDLEDLEKLISPKTRMIIITRRKIRPVESSRWRI